MFFEALIAYFTSSEFWLLFGMFLGSFLIGGMSILQCVKLADEEMLWYHKISWSCSAILAVLMVILFMISGLYLFAGAGMYFELYNV